MASTIAAGIVPAALPDEELAARVLHGETALYEILMRRHNQRLYRAARSIVRDDAEAEDVVQDAWVRAYSHLGQFAGAARFSTWLTRIAVHEALARARRQKRFTPVDFAKPESPMPTATSNPERQALDAEMRALLEDAIDALPQGYRTVFVLRHVEDLNTAETAACLDIPEDTVKTRLHRARGLLRKRLERRAGAAARETYTFGLQRCDRMVQAVMARIRAGQTGPV